MILPHSNTQNPYIHLKEAWFLLLLSCTAQPRLRRGWAGSPPWGQVEYRDG